MMKLMISDVQKKSMILYLHKCNFKCIFRKLQIFLVFLKQFFYIVDKLLNSLHNFDKRKNVCKVPIMCPFRFVNKSRI
jgi:hypothetical protein